VLDVVVEAKEVLRRVPGRLNREVQEVQAHRARVDCRQKALSGATDASEHGDRSEILVLQGSMESEERALRHVEAGVFDAPAHLL
jgi:hypothetical protein